MEIFYNKSLIEILVNQCFFIKNNFLQSQSFIINNKAKERLKK